MTALQNILAGGRLTAAVLQGVAPAAAVKPADETVTDSATLQADNDLFLALPASGTFGFLCLLYAVSSVAQGSGDLKAGWTWPTGASASWSAIGYAATSGGAANINAVRTASGATNSMGVGTTELPVLVMGTIVMGGTAGDLQLEWAQNAAATGNTITLKAQSWLMAWQIA
jgi:hypothetical protein